MKRLVTAIVGVAAIIASGVASAIPYTTGLTLSEATTGTNLCVSNCNGSITIDLAVAGGFAAQADGFYSITGLDILINETVNPELRFGDLIVGAPNFVQIAGGMLTDVFASSSSNNGHFLTLNGSDWNIAGNPALLSPGQTLFTGGGSATKIPEPTSIALLGMGLLAFGAASKRSRKNQA